MQVGGEIREIWELACGVVKKGSELSKMSLDRTEEAVKCHPDSDVINVRRGELPMKNGRFAEATDYFNRLSDGGESCNCRPVGMKTVNQSRQSAGF